MLLLASAICYISAVYHVYINKGKMITVGSVVSFLWGTVNMVNAISPYDWFQIGNDCKIVLLIGSGSLCSGLLVNTPVYSSNTTYCNQNLIPSKFEKYFLLQRALVVVMIPMVIKAVAIMISNNFNMTVLRSIYASGGEGGSYMSTFERLFYIHYIVGPSAFACILIDSILVFRYRMWKKPLIYCVVLALLLAIYSAARTSVFFAAISLFVAFLNYKGHYTDLYDDLAVKKTIRKIFATLMGFMVIITLLRGKTNTGAVHYVFKSIITYFCGGSHILGIAIDNSCSYGLDSYIYGYCTFAGLFSIINFINLYTLVPVNLNLLPSNFAELFHVQDYVRHDINIGTHSTMNAFSTFYYYFMRDGGILYLVIATFVFGRIITMFESKNAKSNSVKNSFIYCLLFYVAIMSVCWWEPIRTEFWMILFWGIIISKQLDKKLST